MSLHHVLMRGLGAVALVAAPMAAIVATAGPAAAAVLTVDDVVDGAPVAGHCTDGTAGNCSVRDAVAAATTGGGDTIVLQAGVNYGLDCPGQGELSHTSVTPLTIQGNGATITQGGQVACPGGTFREVLVDDGPLTQISDTTFTGGTLGSVAGDDVRLTRSAVSGNTGNFALVGDTNLELHQSTVSNNPGNNGALSDGTLLVIDSTISGNSGGDGSGLNAEGHAIVVNSTIVDNNALVGRGGGIFAGDGLDLVYSTVTGNSAVNPAGPEQIAIDQGVFRSFGSVVAHSGDTGDNSALLQQTASASSQGYNFSDDASCLFTATGDRENAGDPVLGALGANGGPTLARVPGAGSPLLDAIPLASCGGGDAIAGFAVTADQRGVSRPQGAGCDVGAVEVQVTAIVLAPDFAG